MLPASLLRPAAFATALAVCITLTGCKIVRDSDKAALDPSDPNNFDAKVYVGALWEHKARAYFDEHAHPVTEVLAMLAKDKDAAGKRFGHRAGDESSPWTFVVRGSGVVKSVDTASHHGEMVVSVGGPAKPVDATLQIGPVIYGTALRDALPFIAFGDFVNQIQYAEVSRALNDRSVASTREALTPPPKAGTRVEFVGAMADPSATGETTVTPVRLRSANVALK